MASPLRIGDLVAPTPVVLAPMAGVTNSAFRRLCREFGGGFYVSEMITSRALVERTPESMRLVSFDEDESPRSIQLYGVDPVTVGAAVRMVVQEDLADHVDLNFGCPVAKVTRKGGGAALPWKSELFTQIIRNAVREAAKGGIPLTVKMRKGIDEDHLTFLEAGRIAEGEGAATVALHARTASDYYSGSADWSAIAALKEAVTTIPVLGNGDIWSAEDALEMMRQTNCDGVVVGRGCLGRPWLFADLEAAFAGSDERVRPTLGRVAEIMRRHAQLLADHFGDENRGCRDWRKHVAWYLKGYPVGGVLRAELAKIPDLATLDVLLEQLDHDAPYPGEAAEGARGRQGSPKKVSLPEGWLQDRGISEKLQAMVSAAEASVSGG
jgi:nifR3 family TIM-barrel protein